MGNDLNCMQRFHGQRYEIKWERLALHLKWSEFELWPEMDEFPLFPFFTNFLNPQI